jgi:hypothetical protein
MKVSNEMPRTLQKMHDLTIRGLGTGSYACLKTNQLPTNEKFVGIDNDFTSTNHYFELAQQLATSYRALQ